MTVGRPNRSNKHVFLYLALGSGYGRIGNRISTRVETSEKSDNDIPLATNNPDPPFHFTLAPDEFVEHKFVEFELPYQVQLSGLIITTTNDNAVKTFRFKYSQFELMFPGEFLEHEIEDEKTLVNYNYTRLNFILSYCPSQDLFKDIVRLLNCFLYR